MSNLNNSDNSTGYSNEDLKTLNDGIELRKRLVNNVIENGLPKKSGDMRVINEILSSNDKSIHDKTNNIIKHQTGQTSEETIKMVASILIESKKKLNDLPDRDTSEEVDDKVLDIDTVEGETDIQPEKLNIEDFITDDKKDR